MPAYQVQTIVQPGHRIVIEEPGLFPEGCAATVYIKLEDDKPDVRMKSFAQVVAQAPDFDYAVPVSIVA